MKAKKTRKKVIKASKEIDAILDEHFGEELNAVKYLLIQRALNLSLARSQEHYLLISAYIFGETNEE